MYVSTRALVSDYDIESDTLYLFSKKERATNSFSFGNLNLDFAKEGTFVGVEFLNASSTLPPLMLASPKALFENAKTLKMEALRKITSASVSLNTAANFLIVALAIEFDKTVSSEKIGCRLTIPVASKKDVAAASKPAFS
ncbi:MAG: DUF2283 domain-containing protein [Candidatus Micrarchaeota archaeon]